MAATATSTDSLTELGKSASGMLDKMNAKGAAEWIMQNRSKMASWTEFVNSNRFRKPTGVKQWTSRAVKNIQHYQTNYFCVFTILIVYCILTSPLLLIAIATLIGGCYAIKVKNQESNIKVMGHEITHAQQYGVVALLSIPLFVISGATSVVFWVLGCSFFLIGLHASFHISTAEGLEDEANAGTFMETV